MDKESEILMREWERRYESYREYRNQYLTVLSICASGYVVGMSLAAGLNIPAIIRAIIFGVTLLGLILLGIAHFIALKAVDVLGERMSELQAALGMRPFNNVWLLKTALRVSAAGTAVLVILTLVVGLYFYLWGR